MAKNDIFLIDGILDQYPLENYEALNRGEIFEFFCLEQLLKSFDLNSEEIKEGHLDGGLDGGIDGGFIFVNGNLVSDVSTFIWPRTDIRVDLFIINCKHHDTFSESTINTLIATFQELFDLSIPEEKLSGSYNEGVLNFRKKFLSVYRNLAVRSPKFTFNTIYASRGDRSKLGNSVKSRSKQIDKIIRNLFSEAKSIFEFAGAADLVTRYRNIKSFDLELQFSDYVSGENNGYIIFSKLNDYFQFITDEHGNLRRYLLDSNIRDYLGENKVNSDIKSSLSDDKGAEFWWLNNGVTILATSASITGRSMIMTDIQIINGLQTSETIYNHFSTGETSSNHKNIAVKVIVSDDKEIRDKIIVASNNQSSVEHSAFRATDKIQQDIEDALERKNWYYERRKNYYRNVGRPADRIIDPMYLAGAYTALILKNPNASARLRSRFMRSDENYSKIFSEKHPLQIWPKLVDLMKSSEEVLIESRRYHTIRGERFVKTWRGLIALLAVAHSTRTFHFQINDVLALDVDKDLKLKMREAWKTIMHDLDDRQRPGQSSMRSICKSFGQMHSIDGWESFTKKVVFNYQPHKKDKEKLTAAIIAQVELLLPKQPWPRGIHNEIAKNLDCKPSLVSAAIQNLIASGRWKPQRNGEILE